MKKLKQLWFGLKPHVRNYILCILFGLFLGIALCSRAAAQPEAQAFDKQIQRSDFFVDEFPNYPVCKIEELDMIDDVTGVFTGGQCLKRNSGNTAWIGGQCGTGGGSGFDFESASADVSQHWIFPLQQKPLTASVNYTTGACPSGWGTNCWSSEPRAVVGSYSGVNGGSPPSDIVLLSNTRIAYASVTDKRATSVWIGTTQYPVDFIAHNGILGVREVVYSTLKTQLPGTNWQGVRFEFSDGTFAPATVGTGVQRTADKAKLVQYLGLKNFIPTQDNIYPVAKEILKGAVSASDSAKTITVTGGGSGGSGGSSGPAEFTALDNLPTDLTPFVNNQVLRINNPAPGKWMEVGGSNTQHGYKIDGATDPNNANNWGVSYFGDIYGSLSTEEGGAELSADQSAIERIEVQRVAGGDDTLTVLIKKADLTTAPAIIFYRIYQKAVGESNDELVTGSLLKGTDNTAHSYHTYLSPSGDGAANSLWEDTSDIKYIRFFRSNPPAGNESSGPLNLHSAKTLYEIDTPTTVIGHRSLSVSQSQRILGFGQYRFVEQSNWTPTDFGSGFNFQFSSVQMPSGAIISRGHSQTDQSTDKGKFYKFTVNLTGTAGSASEITLANGVTYPADFPIFDNSSGLQRTNDDKLIIWQTGRNDTTITHNNSFFVLTLNDDETQITNIRKLSAGMPTMPVSRTDYFERMTIIRGANTLYLMMQHWTERDQQGSGTYMDLYRIDIGQTTSNIIDLTGSGFVYVFSGAVQSSWSWYDDDYFYGRSCGSREYTYSQFPIQETIQKSTYEYIPIQVYCGSNYANGTWKINKATSSSPHFRFSGDVTSTGASSPAMTNLAIPYYQQKKLADGSFYWGEWLTDYNLTENTNSPAVQPSELPRSAASASSRRIATFTNTYVSDNRNTDNLQYFNFGAGQLSNGDIFMLASKRIYEGGTNTLRHKAEGFYFIPVSGDIQTTISRSFSSLLQNLSGHEVSVGATLPAASISGDTHIFDQAVASGLDWLDTDGTTALTSAKVGDWGVYNGTKWVRKNLNVAGFNLSSADVAKDLKLRVEETTPGTQQDKNLAFAASGSTFTVATPFPGVLRLTYNNLSTDTDTYQRFTAFVNLEGGQPSHIPSVLKLGSVNYAFSYLETDAGQAVYKTPKVKASERVTSASTVNAVNIQFEDGSWAGQSGASKVLRTLDKSTLQGLANAVTAVHAPPSSPTEGQRIEMLNQDTILDGAVITAAEASNSLYTGWEDGSALTDHTELGSIEAGKKDLTKWAGLVSFSNARAAGNEANKTMWVFPSGSKPTTVWINGTSYTCGATVNANFCQVGSLDGSFIKPGKRYLVNALVGGQKIYPDVTLSQGSKYIWDGVRWIEDFNKESVDARIQPWARTDNPSGYIDARRFCPQITQSAYTALSTKVANQFYCVEADQPGQ